MSPLRYNKTRRYAAITKPSLSRYSVPVRGRLCIAACWIVSGSLTAVAQQQPSRVPGTFRTAVTLVPVDVRVVDRDGKSITDLTQEEFSVLENGIVQPIKHFTLQSLAGETA